VQTRDIIVIGSSMGGIEALSMLVRTLPVDLPASVLVVQHISPDSPGALADILSSRGPLPAVTAANRMALEHGRIYVAPPDRHLLLTADGIRVTFGPRENRSRPAVDTLFRTAAVNCGSRVIGVVMTGLLGDGAAGLHAVELCGGVPLVQDPDEAAFPEMPARALAPVPTACRVKLSDLGAMLEKLSRQTAPASPPVTEPLKLEARLTERAMEMDDWNQVPGIPTPFTCPECKGAIQQVLADRLSRFRCRVGHAYSPQDLLDEKARAVENTLWVALQTLQERAEMLDTMEVDDLHRGWPHAAGAYADRAREVREQIHQLRRMIASLKSP
jgi:two-component system chemotaxis response regulator CheB